MTRNSPDFFSSAEASDITGVSVSLQRNWFVRGYYTLSKPGTRYCAGLHDLASLLFLRIMSERGIGPGITTVSKSIVEWSAVRIVYDACTHRGAYSDQKNIESSFDTLTALPIVSRQSKSRNHQDLNKHYASVLKG